MKKREQVTTTYSTTAAIAGVTPPPITFDLIGLKKGFMVDAIYLLFSSAYSNVVAGTTVTTQQFLTSFGRASFNGKYQEKMRFLTNVRMQTLLEIASHKGHTFNTANMGAIAGAGAAATHSCMIPFYVCRDKNLANPNETCQASEVFDRAHVEINFGVIPAMGAGAPTCVYSVTPIVIYSERKGNYITPFREISEEDKTVQTDILINSGFYDYIANRPSPVMAVGDTFSFSNNDEFVFNQITAANYAAFASDGANPGNYGAGSFTALTMTLATYPIFSNFNRNKEILKGLEVKPDDNYKLDTVVAGFVANTLIKESVRNIYNDSDVIADIFGAKAVKLTPVGPVASPYIQHEYVAA